MGRRGGMMHWVAVAVLLGLLSLSEAQFRRVPSSPARAARGGDGAFKKWKATEYNSVRGEVSRSAHSFLHDRSKNPLVLPLEVNVALVGFGGDGGYHYKLDPAVLEGFLSKSFPDYRPSCLETHQELEVAQKIKYNVVHVQGGAERMEAVLKDKMVKEETDKPGPSTEYEVEATAVEPFLTEIYEETFDDGSVQAKDGLHYAVIIMNLDKLRMKPGGAAQQPHQGITEALDQGKLSAAELTAQEGGYTYRYRYDGGGPTATWVSSKRYAVVDLSAGPCTYGRDTLHAVGTASPSAIPRIGRLLEAHNAAGVARASPDEKAAAASHRDAIFRGHVSAVVATAVQQLFAPDVRLETLDFAQRVLVPVIVLRNHRRFNPLHPGHEHSIDMAAVRAEVKKMVQPGQEVVVVEGMYSLHEHEHLAMALTKSIRTKSAQHPTSSGQFKLQSRTFIDGWVLLEEFRNSADMLASGLLGTHGDDELHRSFFPDGMPDGPASASSPPAGGKGGGKRRAGSGTRIVPVYVMSLDSAPDGLLLDGEGLVTCSNDMAIVLQTAGQANEVPLDFSSEWEPRAAEPAAPTRHILAGLGAALGGLAAPYERYSPLHGHRVESWIWANGHHPFGPFSNTSGFSELHRDTARRNSILSRVDTALREVRAALDAVEEFAGEFLASPMGGEVDFSDAEGSWLDQLYSDPQKSLPILPPATVQRLERELGEMEEKLVQLGGTLFAHELDKAHVLSSSVLQAVRLFREYVEHELQAARDGLRCCRLHHSIGGVGGGGWGYAMIAVPALLALALISCFGSGESRAAGAGHWKMPGNSRHRD